MEQTNQRTIILIVDYIYEKEDNRDCRIKNKCHRTIQIILQKNYETIPSIETDNNYTAVEEKLIDKLSCIELEIENEHLVGEPTIIKWKPIITYFGTGNQQTILNNIPSRNITLTIDGIDKDIKVHSFWFDNSFVNKTNLKPLGANIIKINNGKDNSDEINRIISL